MLSQGKITLTINCNDEKLKGERGDRNWSILYGES